MLNATHIEDEGRLIIRFEGDLDRDTVSEVYQRLIKVVSTPRPQNVVLHLEDIHRLDSAGVAFLGVLTRTAREKGHEVGLGPINPTVKQTLELFRFEATAESKGKRKPFFETFGERAIQRWSGFVRFLMLAADCFVWTFGGAARTRKVRKGAVWVEGNRIGVDSLPIVGLISFLIGLVLALQSAYQLRQFGADIFVANLIAVSMTREMGPLMTAIIIAGRSGAAIAAEVATMSVNEEIAALEIMGLKPTRYVVVPKFQAITLTMPALTMYANLLGIVCGFLVALLYIGLSPGTFFNQVADALVLKDILTGLVKSTVFAWIIVLIASFNGAQAYGGAESVGRVTTDSVVQSIFWVIVADAFFNIVFYFGD